MDTKTYFGGRPTEPQVRELMQNFESRKQGDSIGLSEISALIHEPIRSSRFETVVAAFRRRLLHDRGYVTERIAGLETIRIVTEDEKTGVGLRGARVGVRKIHRSAAVVSIARPEAMNDQRARDTHFHASRVLDVLVSHTRQAVKEISNIFAPQPQLPRTNREQK